MNRPLVIPENLVIVPIATFFTGFFSLFILSWHFEVLWTTSKYDVPLIYNASVMIGDSVLLPIINYRIFLSGFNFLSGKRSNHHFLIWLLISVVLSVALNIITHNTWKNDNISDFISFSDENFSVTGYWHLVFSIIQTIIFLFLPFFWIAGIKNADLITVKYSIRTWIFFFLFTILSFFDVLNKHLFVYKSSFSQAIKIEGFPFATSLLAIGLLVILKIYQARKHTDQESSPD